MPLSAGIFCPQSRAPAASYLATVRSYILSHPILQRIVTEVPKLKDVYELLATKNPAIGDLALAPHLSDTLANWLLTGDGDAAATENSSIVALPRLVIIQLAQYFQYLQSNEVSHAEVLAQVQHAGGFQGYCGGLPAAIILSCSDDEEQIGELICNAIRVAYAIGLYTELGDDSSIPGATIVAVRLKREGQAEELVKQYPGTYISAITDPRSVSIVGPVERLAELQAKAPELGLLVQAMDIRGKTHNPENTDLATELEEICGQSDLLRLPGLERLKSAVRSNGTGDIITRGSLSEEIVVTTLARRCEWYQLLCNVADALKDTGREAHTVASFGSGDVVPLMAFNRQGLQVEKQDWGSPKRNTPREQPVYPDDAIAIIGASCRLPGASTLEELWEVISKGEDRHQKLPTDRFDLPGSYRAGQSGKFAAERQWYGNFIKDINRFDHAFFGMNKREMSNLDPQQRALLELAYEALEESGYMKTHQRERADPVGCFIGASFLEYLDNTCAHPPTAYTAPGTIRAFLCGRLSYYFGWRGPAEVIDTACSASLVAINRAVKAIQAGECTMALAGGINLITGINNFLDLARAGFLSPTGQCKPFDQSGDGYCRADGAGLIVLKPLKQALADKDRIMAVISGVSTNQGGLSTGLTVPEAKALAELYRTVIGKSGLQPEQITYVEAHGTGTQAGDPLEIQSVRTVLGSPTRARELTVGSIKGNVGHSETAAGVAGLIKILCMMQNRAIPPQASHKVWNPKIPALGPDRMRISNALSPWDAPIRAAMLNSYGAAGSNAAAVLCEPPSQQQKSSSPSNRKYPVVLSAATESSLRRYQEALASYLTRSARPPAVSAVAYTLSEKRPTHKYLTIINAKNTEDVIFALGDATRPIIEKASPPPLILAFGGQSKRTIGLKRDVYENSSTFRTYLDLCNTTLQELGYESIIPAVFETSDVSDIVLLQTGFVSVQYASARTWLDAGLDVKGMLGHSLGELTCLAVSETLSLRDLLQLVGGRASLMKTKWGADQGGMRAVFARREEVEKFIADGKLEIACYNAETSHVVSGESQAMAELEAKLGASSVKSVGVNTSHGFHSRLVEPILEDLEKLSASLDWKTPTIPVYPCCEEPRDSLLPYSPADHARQAVFFSNAVQRIEAQLGSCIWLEAGMDTPVMSMTKRAASSGQKHHFLGLSTKDETHGVDVLSQAVRDLWTLSVPVSHWLFLQAQEPVWLPPYQFEDTTGWVDNIDRAAEAQKQVGQSGGLVNGGVKSTTAESAALPKLVSLSDVQGKVKRFTINGKSDRYRGIVSGHAVRARPLCPASVYWECVAMALDLLEGEESSSDWEFEDLTIQAPLGLGAEAIELAIEEIGAHQYTFSVSSRSATSGRNTLHAKGRFTRSLPSKLETVARLVERRLHDIEESDDAERMLSKRAYTLFARVVTYGNFLRGINHVLIRGSEGLASVTVPGGQPAREQSSAVQRCDAVTLDNFIHVAGLLINTSEMVGDGEVMVCTGIAGCTLSKQCNFLQGGPKTVYASYTDLGGGQSLGDVVAFSADGNVHAAITGCRFVKVEMNRLERVLDSANRAPTTPAPAPAPAPPKVTIAVPVEEDTDSGADTTLTPDLTSGSDDDDESLPDVRAMLESYTGAIASKISDTALITDLGLDSLAAIEMAEELGTACGVAVDSNELLAITVKQLEAQIGVKPPSASPRKAAPVKTPAAAPAPAPAAAPAPQVQAPKAQAPTAGGPARLNELISEMTGVDPSRIQPSMTLEQLGVDSLALMEVITALSDESPHPIDSDHIGIDSTVADVVSILAGKA
ncbi:ketoacyl-synt-domain-containing protein [Aspergillus ellipticus CBS 707.79]|uniref:Ketoacyl-synt-domain-containing protein n=1 Tax=Aspergillus ellipticus CBS 707.79 TaxID=1448320 RepID=A0A319DVA3_9EURO|nr:ketoacyl-synt-domain-containing protein [Aspergillus ellipticus CBS 707.79]